MSDTQRRRNYPIIHRGRQYRLLVLILIYGLVICIYLFLCLFLPDIVAMQDPTEHWAVRSRAADRILMMHSRMWPAVVAMLALVGLHSFRMFAHVIGPLVPIRRALKKMAEGDFSTRLKMRKKDLLLEEAELFNRASEEICDRLGKAQTAGERAAKASADLGALVRAIPTEDGNALSDAAARVDQQITIYTDLINAFKIDPHAAVSEPDDAVVEQQSAGEHAG